MDWMRAACKMLSRIAIALVIVTLIWSLFVTYVIDDTDDHLKPYRVKRRIPEPQSLVMDDSHKHLMWFIQVSDLHLSRYFDPNRKPDFLRFCTETIDAIKPKLVLATGDLTDSRRKDPMGSRQFEDEWRMYREVLEQSGVANKTIWLDVRGNHDNMNVWNWEDENNFYRKYSVTGRIHRRHYNYSVVTQDGDVFGFVAVDACVSPGPKRPFNFMGLLKEEDISQLAALAKTNSHSNMTFWFGHYPTSSIASPKAMGIRNVIDGPYLCGHFHTVGGLVPEMYSTQPTGYLELELADFKDLRKYRLLAVDHGLFSFTDTNLDKWPVILVTNPKPALFKMANLEPVTRIGQSTHVRALVFSTTKIHSVEFRVDDEDWISMRHVDGPLFVGQWDPNKYSTGLHWIAVRAADDHHQRISRHEFSIDDSRPSFPFGARFMLRSHVASFGFWLFGVVVALTVLPLIVLRIGNRFGQGQSICSLAERSVCRRLLFKLFLLATIDRAAIPLIAIPTYACLGPWFVGQLIDGHFGACFVWGLIIDGSYLPGGFTYILGSIFILLFHLPMIILLAHVAYCRRQQLAANRPNLSLVETYCHVRHLFFLFLWLSAVFFSSLYYFAYGTMAYLFGFFVSWPVLIYLVLWRFVTHLNPNALTGVCRVKVGPNVAYRSHLVHREQTSDGESDPASAGLIRSRS